MTTHSSVLAWKIPGRGEPGGLTSMGLHRVRRSDLAVAAAAAAAACVNRGSRRREKDIENLFQETMAENFPNLKKKR